MLKKEKIVNRKNRIKECRADRIFDIIIKIVLFCILVVVAYPLIITVSSSISDARALQSGKVWLFPVKISFAGYEIITKNQEVITGFVNSAIYTVFGTLINMVVTILAAYPLSRKDYRPRTFLSLMFAFTMWFSGGIIPAYILVRDLGMYNTRWAILIPGALNVWNMILLRTYFESSIPGSLFESARLDGCDDFKYLMKIVLPVSKPILAVVALYYGVANWNNFFSAYLYLQKPDLKPLQVVLRDILLMSKMENLGAAQEAEAARLQSLNEVLKYSLVVISSIPMCVLYLFTQKYFTKGIMIGSIKG